MKSKHIAAIALSAMMVFSLAGCGGADSSTAKSSEPETSESTTTSTISNRSKKATTTKKKKEKAKQTTEKVKVDTCYNGTSIKFYMPSIWESAGDNTWCYINSKKEIGSFNYSEFDLPESATQDTIDELMQEWLLGESLPDEFNFCDANLYNLNNSEDTLGVEILGTTIISDVTYNITSYSFVINGAVCTFMFYDAPNTTIMTSCADKMLETVAPIERKTAETTPVETQPPVNSATLGETNALKSAKQYLDFMPFSYQGLIDQLQYEKFTLEESTYAADNCGADWNEQAAKCAQSYIENMSFSRESLIDQLIYEGFTQEQAEYGAQAVGY